MCKVGAKLRSRSGTLDSLNEYLGKIMVMDDTYVSFLMPEITQPPIQWLPKGFPSCSNNDHDERQMVVAFLNMDGLIYQPYVPLGSIITLSYFVDVIPQFMKLDKHGSRIISDAPAHSAKAGLLGQDSVRMITHPCHSPGLVLAVHHSPLPYGQLCLEGLGASALQ